MAKKLNYKRVAFIKALLFVFHFVFAGPLYSVLNFFFDFRYLWFYNPIAHIACGIGGLYVLYAIACWILNISIGVQDRSIYFMPGIVVSQAAGVLLFLIGSSGRMGMSGSVFPASGFYMPLAQAWDTFASSFMNSDSLFNAFPLSFSAFPISYFKYGQYPEASLIAGYAIVMLHAVLAACFYVLYLGKWRKLNLNRRSAFGLKIYFVLFSLVFVILEAFAYGTMSVYPYALIACFLIGIVESLFLLFVYAVAFLNKIVIAALLLFAFVFAIRASSRSKYYARSRIGWIITHFVFGGPLFVALSLFVDFSGVYAYSSVAYLVSGFGGLYLAFILLSKLVSNAFSGYRANKSFDPIILINELSSVVLFGLCVSSDAGAKMISIDFSRIGDAFKTIGNPFLGSYDRVPFSTPLSVLDLTGCSLSAIAWFSLAVSALCFVCLVVIAFKQYSDTNLGTAAYAFVLSIVLIASSFLIAGQAGWIVLSPFLLVFLLLLTAIQLVLYAISWLIAGVWYLVKWILVGIWKLIVLIFKGIWMGIVWLAKLLWKIIKWGLIIGAAIGIIALVIRFYDDYY